MKDAPPAAAAPHQSPSTPGRSPLKARHLFALLLVLTLAGLLARSVPYLRWQPPAAEGEGAADPRVCRGALHVHLPDDEASFLALVAAAREAGLDFVLFAAAGTFDPAADGREGYYTDAGAAAAGLALPGRPPLLVLVGAELPTDRGNLLLAGGQAGTPYPLTRRSETLVRAAREAGGFALALRPCRQPLAPGAVPSPDRPDPPAGVAGVEALSLAADFTSHLYYPLAEAAVLSLANPAGGLARLARRPAGGRPPAAGLDWPGPPAPVGGIGLGAPEPLFSHLRGALNVGAPTQLVEAAVEHAAARVDAECAERARSVWARVRARASRGGAESSDGVR